MSCTSVTALTAPHITILATFLVPKFSRRRWRRNLSWFCVADAIWRRADNRVYESPTHGSRQCAAEIPRGRRGSRRGQVVELQPFPPTVGLERTRHPSALHRSWSLAAALPNVVTNSYRRTNPTTSRRNPLLFPILSPPRPRLRPRRHRVLDPRIAHCRREEDDSPPIRPVETRTFPRSTTAGSCVDRTLAALRLVRARSDPREPRCACRATPERTDRQSLRRHHEPIKGAAVSTHSLRNNPTTVVTLHPFRNQTPRTVVRRTRLATRRSWSPGIVRIVSPFGPRATRPSPLHHVSSSSSCTSSTAEREPIRGQSAKLYATTR